MASHQPPSSAPATNTSTSSANAAATPAQGAQSSTPHGSAIINNAAASVGGTTTQDPAPPPASTNTAGVGNATPYPSLGLAGQNLTGVFSHAQLPPTQQVPVLPNVAAPIAVALAAHPNAPIAPRGTRYTLQDNQHLDISPLARDGSNQSAKLVIPLVATDGNTYTYRYRHIATMNWGSRAAVIKANTWRNQVLARRLSVARRATRSIWTAAEKAIISSHPNAANNYIPATAIAQMAVQLPGRTLAAIRSQANHLKATNQALVAPAVNIAAGPSGTQAQTQVQPNTSGDNDVADYDADEEDWEDIEDDDNEEAEDARNELPNSVAVDSKKGPQRTTPATNGQGVEMVDEVVAEMNVDQKRECAKKEDEVKDPEETEDDMDSGRPAFVSKSK